MHLELLGGHLHASRAHLITLDGKDVLPARTRVSRFPLASGRLGELHR
jgi:hypothetical protein